MANETTRRGQIRDYQQGNSLTVTGEMDQPTVERYSDGPFGQTPGTGGRQHHREAGQERLHWRSLPMRFFGYMPDPRLKY
jgi:hypothetical protein